MVQLPPVPGWLVPCARLLWGSTGDTGTAGQGSGCRLGCQAVQREQSKVSDSVFLPQMKRGTG